MAVEQMKGGTRPRRGRMVQNHVGGGDVRASVKKYKASCSTRPDGGDGLRGGRGVAGVALQPERSDGKRPAETGRPFLMAQMKPTISGLSSTMHLLFLDR